MTQLVFRLKVSFLNHLMSTSINIMLILKIINNFYNTINLKLFRCLKDLILSILSVICIY